MSKLSIITINYNNLDGLKKTVESVISQSWKDFEFIIIDGGSTDGSKEYLEKNQALFSYWVSEADGGIYNAMNKGIKISRGEYVQFLNSGDILVHNGILEQVFSYNHCTDIIYGDCNYIDGGGNLLVYPSLKEHELTLTQFNTNTRATISHPSSFIKGDLIRNNLYDESYKIIADIKFFIEQIILRNCSVKHIPFVISNFYLDGLSSNSKSWEATIKERQRIFKELVPPRILKDIELAELIKDSPIKKYLPVLNNTTGFNKLASKILGYSVQFYQFFKKV